MKILIDNGHGENTPGKKSPDGRLREYAYAREIAKRVVNCLKCKGYDAERIVPEETDIALSVRCKRVNDICRDTNCPAVLTENLFQDNKADVDFLLSDEGKEKVTAVHVNAIVEFIKDYYG